MANKTWLVEIRVPSIGTVTWLDLEHEHTVYESLQVVHVDVDHMAKGSTMVVAVVYAWSVSGCAVMGYVLGV